MTIPNVAVKTIEEIQSDILKKKKKINILQKEIKDLRDSVEKICDHRDPEKYEWEHDNGFGRQSKMIGRRCKYCRKIDLWKSNSWHDISELFNNDYGGYQ